jgi:Cupin domain
MGRAARPAGLGDPGGIPGPEDRRGDDRREPLGDRSGRQAVALPRPPPTKEWALVVTGAPTLRTPDGETTLKAGDVVCFPRGRAGAHQMINRSDDPARVLMLSTTVQPDVVEYLDTDRVLVHDATGDHLLFTERGPIPDYWDGEG